MAMLPSADRAMDVPRRPTAPGLTSLFCCVQTPPLRVNTHAAPAAPRPNGTDRSQGSPPGPPRKAFFPSAEKPRATPCPPLPPSPPLSRSSTLSAQIPPLRVNTHAAPVLLLSDQPPTMAVLPSAD